MGWLTRAFGGDARGPRTVDTALRSALLAVLDRDLDRADGMLAQAVRLDPDDVEAYLALARLYRVRGEIGRAIRVHQNLLLRSDLTAQQRVVVLSDLGEDFRQGGFLRRAIACFDQVIAEDRRHNGALRSLVSLLAAVREFPRAIELTRRLAKLESADSRTPEALLYVEMARTAQAEGRSGEARRAIKRALRRDKGCVAAWVVLGELEAERGVPKAALAAWSKVAQLDVASGPLVYPQLEATYAALGRARDFETYVRELIDAHPADGGARRALAGLLAARGDIDTAVGELRKLLGGSGDDLEARAALGRILLAQSRGREAMQEYGALIDVLERRGLLGAGKELE